MDGVLGFACELVQSSNAAISPPLALRHYAHLGRGGGGGVNNIIQSKAGVCCIYAEATCCVWVLGCDWQMMD